MARTSSFRVLPALVGAVLVSLGAIGCASNEDYTALKMDRDNLAEQAAAARRDAEANRRLAEGYREQLASISAGGAAENAQILNLQQQLTALTGERDELMNKYQALLEKIGTGPALPPPLTHELTMFAEENPNLVTFDANTGIVKFKSDLTFASGDAELTADAKAVLGKFAQILNGPIAKNYRLEIAGHTDNVPVENPETIRKGHKDNWYLSSHRAISVSKALMSQGVVQSRVGVTGYADQKPVASNNEKDGRQLNRRVEVLILPTTVSGVADSPTAQAPAMPEAEPAAGIDEGVSK